MKLTVGMRRLS